MQSRFQQLLASMLAGIVLFSSTTTAQEKKPADPNKPAEKEKITYEQHILPIMREKCGTCHNSNDKKGDLVLDSYAAVMQGGASGEIISSDNDASSSQLYRVVAHLSEPKMPPSQPKLPDAQLDLLRRWIEGGSLKDAGSQARVKKTNDSMARVEITVGRPAGPPPMPSGLTIDPLVSSPRANGVTALATNPWSSLATVSGHHQILLYEMQTLELVGVLPFPEGQPHVLKFSRNGSLLLAGGGRGGHSGKVVVWDVRTGKRITEVGNEYDAVLGADISPDHSLIALGGPKKIVRVYATETGELVYEKNKHTDWVTTMEFSPDGVLLATADRSNGLIVWEASTGREFYVLTGHTAAITDLSWASDSNLLATSSEDGTIRLWEMQNGTQAKNWNAHSGGVSSVKALRDGRFASVGRDKIAKLWNKTGAQERAFPALPDLGTDVAFDGETERLLAGDLSGVIQVTNSKDGAVLGSLTTNPAPVAIRTAQLQQAIQLLTTETDSTKQQLTQLKQGLADRQNAAEKAQKLATDATSALESAMKAKTNADAEVTAKSMVQKAGEAAQKQLAEELAAAKTQQQSAQKAIDDAQAVLKTATAAVTAAESSVKSAKEALQAKPEDAEAKQKLEVAEKALGTQKSAMESAQKNVTMLAEIAKQKSEATTAITTKFTASQTASQQANQAVETALKSQMAAAQLVKVSSESSANLKSAAAKAVAAVPATPDEQKGIASLEASLKSQEEKLAQQKAQLVRLQSAQQQASAK